MSRDPADAATSHPMISLLPVPGLPEIGLEDDLAALISEAIALQPGDIVVVTSKVVSKALGLHAAGEDRASLVLRESTRVVTERMTTTGITRVVAAIAGPVMAGAGIDSSNNGNEDLLLLPHEPDLVAAWLRIGLQETAGVEPLAVVLSDTAGRAWRSGLIDFALGTAGLAAMDDLRGHADTAGRDLAVTVRNLADEIASAADLIKGKLDRIPAAVVRGLPHLVGDHEPAALVRSGPDDWFSLGRAEAVRDALGVRAGSPLSEELGIESVHQEAAIDRAERAIRVALHQVSDVTVTMPDQGAADPAGSPAPQPGQPLVIRLESTDPVQLGRAWARLESALAGERLTDLSATRFDDAVEVTVTGS